MNIFQIEQLLTSNGWSVLNRTKKVVGFEKSNSFLYLKADIIKQPLVIDPAYESELFHISTIPGLVVDIPLKFFHMSNLRKFPETIKGGKGPTRYGIAIGVETPAAFHDLLRLLASGVSDKLFSDLQEIELADVPETQKLELRQTRIGQGKFRHHLLEEFGSKCLLTGIAMSDVLVASHIKPWRSSNNVERLDPKNGILLAAHVDALFDKGYISFTDSGEVLYSPNFSKADIEKFNIPVAVSAFNLCIKRRDFLNYHREHVFLSV